MGRGGGIGDFDFLVGTWDVWNRRKGTRSLYEDPAQTVGREWEEFAGVAGKGTIYFDGRVVIDHYEGTFPNGQVVQGMTVRAFDSATGQWAVTWLDNWQPPDFRPLVGGFREDGTGEFVQVIEGPDGEPLHVRFTWDNMTEEAARWQQAFSLDGGETWDTNWVMEFTRRG